MNPGWQSESIDGQQGGWSCAFWMVAVVGVVTLVVWCSAAVAVVVVQWSCIGVVQLVSCSRSRVVVCCGGAMSGV